MSLKDDALQDIVALAHHNQITLAEIAQALTGSIDNQNGDAKSVLPKLFGYVGGIFVFAGIGVFISMYWSDLGSASRVMITLGFGLVAFVMGLICLTDQKYARATTPLLLMALILQPSGILVMLQEYSSGGDVREGLLFMAAYMLVQQGATFWAKRQGVLAFGAVLFGGIFFANLFDIWDVDEKLIGIVMGSSLLCIAYAMQQSKHMALAPFWHFIGAVLLLWSIFESVDNTLLEPAYLGATAFIIFLSTYVRSRVLLFVGTMAMLIYIGYFTAQHFANTVGWPIALVIIGVALIGLSALALRLNNQYIK